MPGNFKKFLNRVLSGPEDEYARLKAENERQILRDEEHRKSRPRGFPVYINIETTRQCNLTCRMCPFHSSPETRSKWGVADGKMELEVFRIIARQLFPTLKICALSVTGEFTLTEYLPEIFELLGKYGVKFDSFTNAILLTPEISEMMMPHLQCFTVSVDTPVARTYELIRRGGKWGAMLGNVKALMAAREKFDFRGKQRPRIDLQAVLMKTTIETLPELVKMAKRMGFDLVKGVHLGVFSEDMIEESLLRHRDLYNRMREQAVTVAREAGIEILLPPALGSGVQSPGQTVSLEQRGAPTVGCEFLWRRSFINFDSSVFACCAPRPPLVGNLTGATFEEIWRGAAYRQLRNRIYSNDPHPSCVRCWIRGGDIPEGNEEEYLFHIE